jgi:hypothetical protein
VSGETVPASTGLEEVVKVNFIVSLVQENKNNTDNRRMNFFIITKLEKKILIVMCLKALIFN